MEGQQKRAEGSLGGGHQAGTWDRQGHGGEEAERGHGRSRGRRSQSRDEGGRSQGKIPIIRDRK